jgi:hypothetical protein
MGVPALHESLRAAASHPLPDGLAAILSGGATTGHTHATQEPAETPPESGLLKPGEYVDWSGCSEVERVWPRSRCARRAIASRTNCSLSASQLAARGIGTIKLRRA